MYTFYILKYALLWNKYIFFEFIKINSFQKNMAIFLYFRKFAKIILLRSWNFKPNNILNK